MCIPLRLPSTLREFSSSWVSKDVAGRGIECPFGLREVLMEELGRPMVDEESGPLDRDAAEADRVKVDEA